MEFNKACIAIKDIFDKHYKDQLVKAVYKNEKFIEVDFKDLIKYSPTFAEDLLNNPTDAMAVFKEVITSFTSIGDFRGFSVRITNLPDDAKKDIWKIRSKDVDTFAGIRGYIRRVGDVQHKIIAVDLICKECGAQFLNWHLDDLDVYLVPSFCKTCHEKSLKVIKKHLQDTQKLVIEEDPMELDPTQKPRSFVAILNGDLCAAEIDRRVQPSRKVLIAGIIRDKQVKNTLNECRKFILANNIEILDETIQSITYTKEDISAFKKFSQSPNLFEDFAQSVVPNIEGHMTARIAIVLQLIGATPLYLDGNLEERGQIHIMLIGSPGSGKSVMLKRAILFLPGSRFTGGKGATGVGLVAAVTKDEELGGFSLSAGAVAMASGAICSIDEIDKMNVSDIAHMNNAMVDMKVQIDKGNIHGSLETNTAILAAANPKNRVFDKRDLIWKQIGLPKDHLDRYDLIFPIQSGSSEEEKRKVGMLIVGKYDKNKPTAKAKYSREFLMKYIAYAKTLKPIVPDDVQKYIVDNFINIAKPADEKEDAAYFSYRLLTNIMRLSIAVSRTRLSEIVTIDDSKRAINILIDSLKMQEIITKDNLMDYERQEAITPKPKRDLLHQVKDIIKELEENNIAEGTASIHDISKACAEKLKLDDESVDNCIEKLRKLGDIIESRRNQYKLT